MSQYKTQRCGSWRVCKDGCTCEEDASDGKKRCTGSCKYKFQSTATRYVYAKGGCFNHGQCFPTCQCYQPFFTGLGECADNPQHPVSCPKDKAAALKLYNDGKITDGGFVNRKNVPLGWQPQPFIQSKPKVSVSTPTKAPTTKQSTMKPTPKVYKYKKNQCISQEECYPTCECRKLQNLAVSKQECRHSASDETKKCPKTEKDARSRDGDKYFQIVAQKPMVVDQKPNPNPNPNPVVVEKPPVTTVTPAPIETVVSKPVELKPIELEHVWKYYKQDCNDVDMKCYPACKCSDGHCAKKGFAIFKKWCPNNKDEAIGRDKDKYFKAMDIDYNEYDVYDGLYEQDDGSMNGFNEFDDGNGYIGYDKYFDDINGNDNTVLTSDLLMDSMYIMIGVIGIFLGCCCIMVLFVAIAYKVWNILVDKTGYQQLNQTNDINEP